MRPTPFLVPSSQISLAGGFGLRSFPRFLSGIFTRTRRLLEFAALKKSGLRLNSRSFKRPRVDSPQSENVRWFADEVQPHDAALKRYLRRSFPAVRDVEDIVQESYVRIWRRQLTRPIIQVTGTVTASVKGFLFQIARRLAVDTLRHDRASPFAARGEVTDLAVSSVIEERATCQETVCSNEEFELVLAAIEALPARCRAVVILRKLQGLSAADTARELGLSEETVHVQTRRGLQRVQEQLNRRGVIRPFQP